MIDGISMSLRVVVDVEGMIVGRSVGVTKSRRD